MAYQHKVYRVTISGTCFGGNEIWSTGFFMGSETEDIGAVPQTLVDEIATRWSTFFVLSGSSISSNYLTTQVKVALLSTAGVTDPLNVVYHTYTTPPQGANGGTAMPPQSSLVCTLTSAISRGLAAKGRMYIPGFAGGGPDATGHISSTAVGNIATALQTFINGVNTDVGAGFHVINASFGSVKHSLPGVNAVVTGIKVGNVYDTQRRRRNGLVEAYTAKTIP